MKQYLFKTGFDLGLLANTRHLQNGNVENGPKYIFSHNFVISFLNVQIECCIGRKLKCILEIGITNITKDGFEKTSKSRSLDKIFI